MSELSHFYNLTGPTTGGYWLTDIRSWSDVQLEEVHDYIQWLFPLKEASRHNPYAPLLTDEDIAAIHIDKLRQSFITMCNFYGIEYLGTTIIKNSTTWAHKGPRWITPHNHNYLRLTRILKSLTLFGMDQEAVTLELFLEGLYEDNPDLISEETMNFWREATQ